jgi:hypothetical protein
MSAQTANPMVYWVIVASVKLTTSRMAQAEGEQRLGRSLNSNLLADELINESLTHTLFLDRGTEAPPIDQSGPSNTSNLLPDPEEPSVEDDFGWPILEEIMATSKIFHAAVPPLNPPERWAGVWAGIGCMSDMGWPFELLEMLIGIATVARRLRSKCKVLVADEHAKTTEADSTKVLERAERLRRDLSKILFNLQFPCEVFLASSLQGNVEYQACLGLADDWQRKFEPSLPAYLKLGMADSAFMALNKHVKVGWSTSPKPTLDKGGFHEPATDLRARQLQGGFGGIYTRPGFTLHRNRPIAAPYTELVSQEDRLMLTGGQHNYRRQVERSNRSPKTLKSLEQRLGFITAAFELEFGLLDGNSIFDKAETLARIATTGL